ncbi:5'-3' exonuclease [Pontibacillus halophilus JSM 076056 = DSM 19796]|uniref:5'-3' exonuclease n=1 Tax=Pontibacillus halophilus JSM 076056 = DSM 19796 TaxID=1385510 RepID=A0A0A5I862_9BACI|nr:5'-3' exonuclease H3TH domain-containing protein [Pontibacillus halophilus]KGX91997.1 5'-3' exonuclease [Pontibacillus halophilus JSM 076056 = DSM 19796]
MNKNHVLLVDGMALLFRSFYATAMSGYYMINSKGIPTNAIHGFVKHLYTAMRTYEPTHVVVCWDMGSKTFRNETFQDYKSNRSEPPEQLIPQFDLVKEVVEAMDIPNVGLKGYEADDCIGTLASQYDKEANVSILTGDQDILQVATDRTTVVLLKKGYGNYAEYNPTTYYEEKGITPDQIVDLKALMGDSSDNYPGVKGIGEKTALKLIKDYGSIEGILANLDSLTKSQKKKIKEGLDMLYLSRSLAAIYCEVPVDCHLDTAVLNMNHDKVRAKFEELEFKRIDQLMTI